MPPPTTLEQIATWAATTTPEWPATSVTPAIHAIKDTVACMVSGASDAAAEGVRTTVHSWPAVDGGATVIGPFPFVLLICRNDVDVGKINCHQWVRFFGDEMQRVAIDFFDS